VKPERKRRIRADKVKDSPPGHSDLIGRCRPVGVGLGGKRQAEKPEVAAFATKRFEENAGQYSFFQNSSAP